MSNCHKYSVHAPPTSTAGGCVPVHHTPLLPTPIHGQGFHWNVAGGIYPLSSHIRAHITSYFVCDLINYRLEEKSMTTLKISLD